VGGELKIMANAPMDIIATIIIGIIFLLDELDNLVFL
jgi:hypothetical protein